MELTEEQKKTASEIIGVPGLKYKVGETRYNARWEEMEFVESGVDGSADIWRVKADRPLEIEPDSLKVPSGPELNVEDEANEEESKSFKWNMKKDDIMAELEKLDIVFDPTRTRSSLLKLLRKNI